jgi:predicted kinase
MKPSLIVVSGPPCAGKTTLAKLLGQHYTLPVMGKDALKEVLFETIGLRRHERPRVFWRASVELLFQFVETQLTARQSCIVESNFRADVDGPRFLALHERFSFVAISVHCFADVDVLFERFKERSKSTERHPGHQDHLNVDEVRSILFASRMMPLTLGGPVIQIDTTNFVGLDLPGLYDQISRYIAQGVTSETGCQR